MKNKKHMFIFLLIISALIFGFLSIPETKTNVTLTTCEQYFCVTPAQVTMIHVWDSTDTEIGNCTTVMPSGCCNYPMVLIQGCHYRAVPDCGPWAAGTPFVACSKNPVMTKCD